MHSIALSDWRLPGCDTRCERGTHDPFAHEAWGYRVAQEERLYQVVRTGSLVVDLASRLVTVAGEAVALPEREYEVLAFLTRNLGKACPSVDIVAAVWGAGWVDLTQVGGTDGKRHGRRCYNMLNTTIGRLRGYLGPDAGGLITTLPGWSKPCRRLDKVAPYD